MLMPRRRLLSIALLLVLLTAALAPAAGAGAAAAFSPQPSSFILPTVRVLASTEAGITFVVNVPWQDLSVEPIAAGGREYVRVSLPGWDSLGQARAPELPFLARAIGAPFGAEVAVQVTPGKAHTIALPAPVLPVAAQTVDRTPPARGAAPVLPAPRTVTEEDAAIYAGAAVYPAALAAVTSDGVLRQQRVAGIGVYPVQYDPAARVLTVYESLTVQVTFGGQEAGGRGQAAGDRGQAAESSAYEEIFRQELLNYEDARGWRQSAPPLSPAGRGAGGEATPWAPPVPGWRVRVQQDGFHRLTRAALGAAGLPVATLDPRTFKLYNLGSQVAIYVEGQADGSFDANDTILFYGQAVASKYTADNVYWLTYGGSQGLRMAARDGTPGTAASPAYTGATRRQAEDVLYITDMPGSETAERWLWADIYPTEAGVPASWSTTFSLAAPYTGAYTARLRLALYGGLDFGIAPDHHTQVRLNGTLLEDARWDGMVVRTTDVTFPQSLLVAGDNTLEVTCPNDGPIGVDLVYVDWAELTFADTFVAVGDDAAFGNDAAANPAKYQITGFSTAQQAAVYDVTDPKAVVRINNIVVTPSGAAYTATFQDTAAAGTRYRAAAGAAYTTVDSQRIEADTPSNLAAATNGADWVVITHAAFSTQAAALAAHRASQGLRTALADVQDVYDEFGYGITGAAAIRDFLAYAYAHWQAPAPTYVVLVGDGHFDPKNHLGLPAGSSRVSFMPPYLARVDPWMGETAADNRYVTMSGSDTLPDMLLGRLSVNSAADAGALVNKIIAYETAPPAGAWQQQVLAVADNADGAGNFALMSNTLLAGYLPAPYTATKVHYGVTHTTVASARAAIQAGINAGKLIVNYIGHAGTNAWADESLFTTTDVAGLTNGAMLPVMLPMTCYDGFYHNPFPLADGWESLGEVVTRISGKGAVASWSPTGLGIATGHDMLDKGFFTAIFTNRAGTVGAGTASGKLALYTTGSNLDLLDTYLLFGDPATRMPTACAAPAAGVSNVTISKLGATQVQLGWSAAGGALLYQVWWKANNFYFTPGGASCTEANGCAWRSATSFTHAGGLGNTGVNNSYVVLPAAACGAVQPAPSNRTGEFDFSLTPGNN